MIIPFNNGTVWIQRHIFFTLLYTVDSGAIMSLLCVMVVFTNDKGQSWKGDKLWNDALKMHVTNHNSAYFKIIIKKETYIGIYSTSICLLVFPICWRLVSSRLFSPIWFRPLTRFAGNQMLSAFDPMLHILVHKKQSMYPVSHKIFIPLTFLIYIFLHMSNEY